MPYNRSFNPSVFEQFLNLQGKRPAGTDTEEALYSYLTQRYKGLKFHWGNRKGTYDIYSLFSLFDAVGVDKHYRLILDHKDIKKHREEANRMHIPGYISFQFPINSGYWFFLPVKSKIITKACGRPTIDGYVLSACIKDPINAQTELILKPDWFKNTVSIIINRQ